MESLLKFVLFIVLLVVSFIGTVFYIAPVMVSIYNMTLLPITGVVINPLFFIGINCIATIINYRYKQYDDETHGMKSQVMALISLWLLVAITYGMTKLYVMVLS